MDLVYCQFLKTLTELLKLKRQCVLSARQLLEDFMALYVIKDPFINDSDSAEVRATKWQLAHAEEEQIRQSLRTDFQFGEMAFSYLLNCPFFDYMVLRTRTVIRRENCQPGCIDQSDPDDPNKFDRLETVTGSQEYISYPVPMPNKAERESLEQKFLSEFNRPEEFEKECPVHSSNKKQSIVQEVSKLPNVILLSLQRGFHDANNQLCKKMQAVLLDKEFDLMASDGSSLHYELYATARHVGSVHSGHWIASVLTQEVEQDGSKIWATINDDYPITKADVYDLRMSTLFLYKKA